MDFTLHRRKKRGTAVPLFLEFFGRGGGIRTRDPLHPMQVRYQAALRPEQKTHCIGHLKSLQVPYGKILIWNGLQRTGNLTELLQNERKLTVQSRILLLECGSSVPRIGCQSLHSTQLSIELSLPA